MSKHFVVTLVQNPDNPDKCTVFVTTQRDNGVCWPSSSVQGNMDHKFQAALNENTSQPVSTYWHDQGLQKEILCISQTLYNPLKFCTEINTVLLHKQENEWMFLVVFQTFCIENTAGAGHIQLATVVQNDQSNFRIFFYFWQKNKTELGFYDMNPNQLKILQSKTPFKTPFFWRSAPLHDNDAVYFSHGTKLLPCGLLVGPCILTSPTQSKPRYFLDLKESSLNTNITHVAPYTIASLQDLDSTDYSEAAKSAEIKIQLKDGHKTNHTVKNVSVGSNVKGEIEYSFEKKEDKKKDKKEEDQSDTNPELKTNQIYTFHFQSHLGLYGVNRTTRIMEKITHVKDIFLYAASDELKHGKAKQMHEFHTGDVHGIRMPTESKYYFVSNNSAICTLEKHDGHSELFNPATAPHAELNNTLNSIQQIGQTGNILCIEMDKSSSDSFFILTQDKETNSFSLCTLWQVNWQGKNIVKTASLTTTDRNSQVFMAHHTTNHWQKGNSKPMCICVLFNNFHMFTCTCAGSNASKQRISDCFAGNKASFYLPWLQFIDSKQQKNAEIVPAVPTKNISCVAGFV